MPMTTHRLKSKQEIEFQYGGHPFSETGSCFISTVDWDISSKYGTQIDFHRFKRIQSLKLNSQVDFQIYLCHLEKSIWHQKSANVRPITKKFRMRMQNDMQIITHNCRSKSKLEVKFLYGGRPSSETGSTFISNVDWDILSKFGMQINFHLLKRVYLIEK